MTESLVGIGGLLAVLAGLIVALRTGTLVAGAELLRQEKWYREALDRERLTADRWQAAHDLAVRAADTALETSRLLAQQNDRLASGQELTERLIESLRQKVGQ
jgi:hypothetical protein